MNHKFMINGQLPLLYKVHERANLQS